MKQSLLIFALILGSSMTANAAIHDFTCKHNDTTPTNVIIDTEAKTFFINDQRVPKMLATQKLEKYVTGEVYHIAQVGDEEASIHIKDEDNGAEAHMSINYNKKMLNVKGIVFGITLVDTKITCEETIK